jgi:hypothetical protein
MGGEPEDVPRPIRVLAALSAGVLAFVLVIPVFTEIMCTPRGEVHRSEQEWDKLKNDIDKAETEGREK